MAVLLVAQLVQSATIQQSATLRMDSLTAMAFHAEREYLRLRQSLDHMVHTPETSAVDDLRLRYDIFISRLNLLHASPSFSVLRGQMEYASLMPELGEITDRLEKALDRSPLQTDELALLLTDFNAIGPDFQALSVAANSGTSQLLEHQKDTLLQQNERIVWLIVAQMLLLLVASMALWGRQRKQVRDRRDLEQLTEELRQATAQAENANRSKSQFLANMSHELRTPFNGMLGMLHLLESTPLNRQQTEYLQTARDSAKHLLSLLNDLLDASALEAGKMGIHATPTHLPTVLQEVEALMRPLALRKQLSLAFAHSTPGPEWVLADGTRLRQILLNLVSNAIKFSEQGEIRVTTARADTAPLGPGAVAAWRVQVIDQGIGMDAATQSRLFQRFSQGDASTARRFGGTGLGLEISLSLARLMGGNITVQSTAGHGSTFTLELPLPCTEAPYPPDAPPTEWPAPPPATQGAGQRPLPSLDILVAEDQAVNRHYISALLQQMGHTVRLAHNGEQAVAEVVRKTPDVVLMDLHMPVMDGLQATQALRSRTGPAAEVLIIALTADAFPETRAQALAAGMDDFLSKPVSAPEIEHRLTEWFGSAEQVPAPDRPTPPAAAQTASEGAVVDVLDMDQIGEICAAISLEGYRSLLDQLFLDRAGTLDPVLAPLREHRTAALQPPAHALKGSAACLGLRQLADCARHIEHSGADFNPAACERSAQAVQAAWDSAQALCQRMGLSTENLQAFEPQG
ncbi:MAG: ATP-binding protein [Burkholderiaceae bacterium]|nr:ATP-binding protein [Burkholderiaceae bacterium]